MDKTRCYVDDRLCVVKLPAKQKAIVNVLPDDTVEIAFFEPITHNKHIFAALALRYLWQRNNYPYFKSRFPSAETCELANQDQNHPIFWGCHTSSRTNNTNGYPTYITLDFRGVRETHEERQMPNVYCALHMPLSQFRLINRGFDVNDYLFSSTLG